MIATTTVYLPREDAERLFVEATMEDALRDLAMALFAGMGDVDGATAQAKKWHLTGRSGDVIPVRVTIEAL